MNIYPISKKLFARSVLLLGLITSFLICDCDENSPTNIPDEYPPDAPSDLRGLVKNYFSIQLAWTDNSDDEIYFLVYRGLGNFWAQACSTAADDTTYTDTGLQEGETYQYYVIAVSDIDISDSSNVVTITLTEPAVEQIAFTNINQNYNRGISIMNADGSNCYDITDYGDNYYPAWSPDGSRIAYCNNEELYIMNADGSNQYSLTSGSCPDWSPDGNSIVFSRGTDSDHCIYIIDIDGSNLRRITHNIYYVSAPAWSPNGTMIAFSSSTNFGIYQIFVVDIDGANLRNISENIHRDYYALFDPDWSPDGEKIVFELEPGTDDGVKDIYIVNADGTNPQNLTNGQGGNMYPEWSSYGNKIAFCHYETFLRIYIMNIDGSGWQNISNNNFHEIEPAWRPNIEWQQ